MKTIQDHPKWVLLIPIFLIVILDATLTLYGQSIQYWLTEYSEVNEASKNFKALLSISPYAFVFGVASWIVTLAVILKLSTRNLALFITVVVCLCHSSAASTWIMGSGFPFNYQLMIIVNILQGSILSLALISYTNNVKKTDNNMSISPIVKAAIFALLILSLYIFLAPE
ncbi:hypothetical protein L2755_09360 [Shewanella abyssi]|uniref:hypothetical protein n=1 Tax=Shewanella abyssi TaxID=311789 RepID=UPI0020109E8A|nr:hypothetical protein [Shewanella abyssi]MCL1049827.1 hypothetical protein [Shewanella abyssi]